MSEVAEKETEIVVGIIGGITLKKEGTWTVSVTPDGSQYSKNLWTKDAELVATLSGKMGQQGAFVCNASYWRRPGANEDTRSLWIDSASEDTAPGIQNATPSEHVPSQNGSEGMTPEKWDAKERRDYRSRAWAQTLAAFQHTIKVEEDPVDVFVRLQPFQRKVFVDVCEMFAYPSTDVDENIPF